MHRYTQMDDNGGEIDRVRVKGKLVGIEMFCRWKR